MAHFVKYKEENNLGSIIKHDRREQTFFKDNINKDLSHLNYNLHEINMGKIRNSKFWNIEGITPEEVVLKERILEINQTGRKVKDDAVLITSVVITIPKDFPEDENLRRLFFQHAKEFLDMDFKKENCLSAVVHRDECFIKEGEKTADSAEEHLHYKFMPIMEKEKKYKSGKSKMISSFCAKELISQDYLNSFHERLKDYLESKLGFEVNVLNGSTIDGNKSIEQLKRITRMEQKEKELESEIYEREKIKESISDEIKDLKAVRTELENDTFRAMKNQKAILEKIPFVKNLLSAVEDLKKEVISLKNRLERVEKRNEHLEEYKDLFLFLNDKHDFKKEFYEYKKEFRDKGIYYSETVKSEQISKESKPGIEER